MPAPVPIEGLVTACKRYGPGRLPKADRRSIGAGYAGAFAALAIAVSYALGMFALHSLGSPFWFVHAFWGLSSLVALPIVVSAAFVSGGLVWRTLPTTAPYFGAVAGLLATVTTYAISLVLVFLLFVVWQLTGTAGTGAESIFVGAAGLTAAVGIVSIVLTGWLTVPLGCLGGAIYERARTVS